jgi:hypothetical protein
MQHVKSVKVKFKSGKSYYSQKEYTYKALPTLPPIVVGSKVVVDSPYEGMQVVDVVGVSSEEAGTKYIVDVVDTTHYETFKAKEKRMAEVKKELAAVRKKVEEIAIYKLLAKDSPEIQALLREMETLEGK